MSRVQWGIQFVVLKVLRANFVTICNRVQDDRQPVRRRGRDLEEFMHDRQRHDYIMQIHIFFGKLRGSASG